MYETFIEGEGLIGDQYFTLEANQTKNYEVLFSPQRIGTCSGQVSIVNEKLGEAWYDLKLIGEQCPPIKLPLFKCDLGKFCTKDTVLDNNSNQVVEISHHNTNAINYQIFPEKISIQPYSSTTIQIKYNPTNFDVLEQGELHLKSQTIGDWKFEL